MQNNWNLDDIYSSTKDVNLDSDIKKVGNLVSDFSRYKEQFSLTDLKEAVLLYEQIVSLLEKISAYAFLYLQTRLDDNDALTFYQEKSEWLCEITAKISFFYSNITKLKLDDVESAIEQDSSLQKYKSWILNCFKYKDHLLSNDAEEVLAQKFVTSHSSWIRVYDEILVGMEFNISGETKFLPEMLEIAAHDDSEKNREDASRIISERLRKESFYIKHIYNNIILDRGIENKLRKYEAPESFRHLDNNIDQQVVDYLTDAVVEGYEKTTHKYYKLKAKLLGKDKLEYWDRNVSVKLSSILNRKFDYEHGKNLVLETFGEFSEVFKNIASDFISKNWIDVYPKKGKTSGAFSHSCSVDVHPYVLLNYFNTIRDVSTLAHELGHGIHQTLSAKNGALLAETPLTLSEVASLFSEKLLFEKIFKLAESKEEKIDLLCWKLDDTMNSIMRQIAFFKFERIVHKKRLSGELSVDDFSNAFLETQRKCLGEYVNVDNCIGIYWTYISHFFHSPFYVYAYAFADIFVNTLYSSYRQMGYSFIDKYIDMLSKGGIVRYDVAAESFGLDPKNREFWKSGISFIYTQIEYLENLCNGQICN